MDQYPDVALSTKDLMIHITSNESYNIHSFKLILQHIETLVRYLIF